MTAREGAIVGKGVLAEENLTVLVYRRSSSSGEVTLCDGKRRRGIAQRLVSVSREGELTDERGVAVEYEPHPWKQVQVGLADVVADLLRANVGIVERRASGGVFGAEGVPCVIDSQKRAEINCGRTAGSGDGCAGLVGAAVGVVETNAGAEPF